MSARFLYVTGDAVACVGRAHGVGSEGGVEGGVGDGDGVAMRVRVRRWVRMVMG